MGLRSILRYSESGEGQGRGCRQGGGGAGAAGTRTNHKQMQHGSVGSMLRMLRMQPVARNVAQPVCWGVATEGGHGQRLKLAGVGVARSATGGHNLCQWGARWNARAMSVQCNAPTRNVCMHMYAICTMQTLSSRRCLLWTRQPSCWPTRCVTVHHHPPSLPLRAVALPPHSFQATTPESRGAPTPSARRRSATVFMGTQPAPPAAAALPLASPPPPPPAAAAAAAPAAAAAAAAVAPAALVPLRP